MFEADYLIVCDGGSRGNGTQEAEAFGSYHLENRDGRKQTVRLEFGSATNNEAEYRTLIAALEDLSGRISQAGKKASDYSVLVQTDSQLMVGQLVQGWACKAANLRPLLYEADVYKAMFGRCDVVKVPRDAIVRVLGH